MAISKRRKFNRDDLSQLRKLNTTDYLMASPRNRGCLLDAVDDAKAGKGRVMAIPELLKRARDDNPFLRMIFDETVDASISITDTTPKSR